MSNTPEKNHPKDAEYIQRCCEAIDREIPDNTGFIVLVATVEPYGSHVRYGASVRREDAIKMMKETLFKWGEGEEWMKHIGV